MSAQSLVYTTVSTHSASSSCSILHSGYKSVKLNCLIPIHPCQIPQWSSTHIILLPRTPNSHIHSPLFPLYILLLTANPHSPIKTSNIQHLSLYQSISALKLKLKPKQPPEHQTMHPTNNAPRIPVFLHPFIHPSYKTRQHLIHTIPQKLPKIIKTL